MKKSILISEIFPPLNGGSGRWFWELYSRLPRSDYFVVAGEHENAIEFDKTHDMPVVREPLSCWTWGIKSVDGFKYYWRAFWSIKKHIKNNNIQTIHCGRCLPEGFMGFLLSKFLRLPLTCFVHGEDVEAASQSRELTWMVKSVLSHCSVIICNSQNTANLLTNNWSVPAGKIKILNPGVDADLFIPAQENSKVRAQLGWAERPVVLTVGRLQKRKGQDMFIQALPEMIKKIPDILYAIVGGGEERPHLDKLVSDLNLENHVMFMDEISDQIMLQCYQQCSLFILPNRTVGRDIEGFGMVLVEAQSCGKAVIAGDSGGTRETMILDKSGFIIDCTEPSTIASKVTEALTDLHHLSEMGKVARQHVVENLDWKAHVNKAKHIFRNL